MAADLDLNPEDFTDTAHAVVKACADAADLGERVRLLAEAGLTGVLAPEGVGGMALPPTFAVSVLRAAGAGLLAAPLMETMLLARAFADEADMCAQLVSGHLAATIAWSGELDGGHGVVGRAPLVASCDRVLAFRRDGTAVLLTLGDGAEAVETRSLDLERTEGGVQVDDARGPELPLLAARSLRSDAQILWSALILGAAEDCLARAAAYAQERRQFGRPLSANQAIQHHLARELLAVETIRNSLTRCLSPHCATPLAAARATFLGATRLGVQVAENAIQIHGGMGFAWDVPLHRHLRQILTMAAQGGAANLMDAVVRDLLSPSQTEERERHAG